MKIRIGTRSSKLALWQAEHISGLLTQNGAEVELITMETKGDKVLDKTLSKIGSKGVFTEELEEMLENGMIDIAVHSAKDLQSSLNDGLEIIAFTEREEACDVLVSFNPNINLSSNAATIGTSSTRRIAMLKHLYPGISITDARGNLQTRFRKMEEKQYDAMLLAYAGVHRMDYDQYIVQKLPMDVFIPAVGQGSIAVEAHVSLENKKRDFIRKLTNHAPTEKILLAERAYLKKLEGGCSIPIFANGLLEGEQLILNGGIISLDGTTIIRKKVTGNSRDPKEIGIQLAEAVFSDGGEELLEEIKRNL